MNAIMDLLPSPDEDYYSMSSCSTTASSSKMENAGSQLKTSLRLITGSSLTKREKVQLPILTIDDQPKTYPSYLVQFFEAKLKFGPLTTDTQRDHLKELKAFLKEGLNATNHKRFLHLVLFAEEYAVESDLNKCSQFNVPIVWATPPNRNQVVPSMYLEGVEDNMPRVRPFDKIDVRFDSTSVVRLTVSSVEGNRLFFKKPKLNASMKKYRLCQKVQFVLNRLNFENGHTCLNRLTLLDQLRIFPHPGKGVAPGVISNNGGQVTIKLTKADLFNANIGDNAEQLRAVSGILNGTSGIHPYILFGPPGTGKTVTVVEAISQVFRRFGKAKILVCAPSNAAANLLAIRLLENIPQNSIMRGMSISRLEDKLPKILKRITEYGVQWRLDVPDKDIIVTTLSSASLITNTNFTHVFIDEAGQATESEYLFATVDKLTFKSRVVLSGDPYQLGPVVKSGIAQAFGFEMSLMERLIKTNPRYQKCLITKTYDGHMITKLLKNYRSHAQLLSVSSSLFYDGELLACSPINARPNLRFPITFCGVRNVHSRGEKSCSLFNRAELEVALRYVSLLRGSFSEAEIGIISPYRAQVRLLQERLGSTKIMIGSTEEYQGQERPVIIVSTVRSNLGLDSDETNRASLGFLNNAKRFNVAVTRAKERLILIGDPALLSTDPNWKTMLNYVIVNGGYTGYRYSRARKLLAKTKAKNHHRP
ncbi:putative helicase MOV-10 isoform X2 [Tigriopus californicus]|uniref:putative helicase MOV-10 isoform X2 n=1 Tax=Tigriopus californicus TaxID=6832 RepID=UPI0027DA5E37|nr:putative helicase MOV-10 isoform X2 [Tigriopus californicus]